MRLLDVSIENNSSSYKQKFPIQVTPPLLLLFFTHVPIICCGLFFYLIYLFPPFFTNQEGLSYSNQRYYGGFTNPAN